LIRAIGSERRGQRTDKIGRDNVGKVAVRRGVRLLHLRGVVTGTGNRAGIDDQGRTAEAAKVDRIAFDGGGLNRRRKRQCDAKVGSEVTHSSGVFLMSGDGGGRSAPAVARYDVAHLILRTAAACTTAAPTRRVA